MEQVYENHRVAAKACVLHENGLEMPQAGYFQQLPELKSYLFVPPPRLKRLRLFLFGGFRGEAQPDGQEELRGGPLLRRFAAVSGAVSAPKVGF